jgi:sec-independent protein translocase protein TatC
MSFADRNSNSEDLFADTRMTFGEHLEDLSKHMWRALYGFLVALLLGFAVSYPVLRFISAPVERQLQQFYDERIQKVQAQLDAGNNPAVEEANAPRPLDLDVNRDELTKALGVPIPAGAAGGEWVKLQVRVNPVPLAIAMARAQQLVYKRPGLSTLGPMEAFMALVKVSFLCGFVLGSPWIFMQLWAFVAAGLYPHEKRLVNVYLPVSIVLFLGGALLCQFLVIPKALEALLWFNYWTDLEPDLRFNEWLSFAILLPVLFGLSFQLPMVMLFLERIGIMAVESYLAKWRIAVFLIWAFAAIVTPIDVFSMASLAVTMCALYGLGIGLCWLNPRNREEDIESPDSQEMVEV